MPLPPELRALCFQLSSTPTADLPRLTPTLLQHVSRCQTAFSSPAGSASKAEASGTSIQVQVHKLKTQISTLLIGKSAEGRFTAVVLIKGVVEVGGWEVLRGAEPWVRGLLSILGKPDSLATKELCIIALTKIYCMTNPYQTLMREITTPTLPAFVAACLNLLASKSSSKTRIAPTSTNEVVLRSLATLLPRHTTILRPFAFQLRAVAKPYLASTISDGVFVSPSMAVSARRLVVLSHLTVAKGGGGEELGKVIRELIRNVHVTCDLVFRAVLEDWESTAGYHAAAVDVNAVLSGGAMDADDLPSWNGIAAGVERVVGLLELLAEYFKNETSLPVSMPLGSIVDLLTRNLSIAIPSPQINERGSARLHPAIDGDEKAGLWAGMPQIYVAALRLMLVMEERLQQGFMSMAEQSLGQLAWTFPYGKHDADFRLNAYRLAKQLLLQVGQSLSKQMSVKCSVIIRSCCNDLIPTNVKSINTGIEGGELKSNGNTSNTNQNADTFLHNIVTSHDMELSNPALSEAATELLPLFFSHIPQRHSDISLRSLIERTAILTHNQSAMVSSVLSPFIEKNGKAMTSILPHLTQAFSTSQVSEILLRPRMPLITSIDARLLFGDGSEREAENEDMDVDADNNDSVDATFAGHDAVEADQDTFIHDTSTVHQGIDIQPGLGATSSMDGASSARHFGLGSASQTSNFHIPATFSSDMQRNQGLLSSRKLPSSHSDMQHNQGLTSMSLPSSRSPVPYEQSHGSEGGSLDARPRENVLDHEDSDDESVHLNMELDTESESEA